MHTNCREMIGMSQRFSTAGEAERWASYFCEPECFDSSTEVFVVR